MTKTIITSPIPRDYQGKIVNPHIGPLTKVIPLQLFLDIVPSSSAEITRTLRGCFREGSVYMYVVSFRFLSFQSKGKPPTLLSCLL